MIISYQNVNEQTVDLVGTTDEENEKERSVAKGIWNERSEKNTHQTQAHTHIVEK